MSKASPTFQDASERLELVFSTVAGIAGGCDVETARLLLDALELDDVRYGKIIVEALDKLATVSDGPIKWAHGRGLSAIARTPKVVYPHVWSSAHEAAFRLSRLARELFDSPEALTERRRKALAMTRDEVAGYQERIRRERAKILATVEPKAKLKGKPGRPSTLEEARSIVWAFEEGKTDGLWKSQVEYLRKKHAKRYRENPDATEAWFSMMRKRVKEADES